MNKIKTFEKIKHRRIGGYIESPESLIYKVIKSKMQQRFKEDNKNSFEESKRISNTKGFLGYKVKKYYSQTYLGFIRLDEFKQSKEVKYIEVII